MIALVATVLNLPGGGRGPRPSGPAIVPTTAPDVQPSALAVLRSDGLHIGTHLITASDGVRELTASSDGRYVSWLSSQHAFRYDTTTGSTTDLGAANAVAWSPGPMVLAIGRQDGLHLLQGDQDVLENVGGGAESLVWSSNGQHLAVQTAGLLHLVILVEESDGRLSDNSYTAIPDSGADTKPAGFGPGDETIYGWSSLNSASLAADGLDLRSYRIDTGAATDVGTTLARPDWFVGTSEGPYVITGGGRDAIDRKTLRGPTGTVDNGRPGIPISIAYDSGSGLLARVTTEPSELVLSLPHGGEPPVLSDGIKDPLAVTSAPGGFLVLTATELWSVSTKGRVVDLGTVDTAAATDHGIVTATDLVVPAMTATAAPTPAPETRTDGLAAVLRSDGLHVTTSDGLRLVPGTKAASGLGQSRDGSYLTWEHDRHAFIRDRAGTVTDLGSASAAAWDPLSDTLAVPSERGLELIRPSVGSDGAVTYPKQTPITDLVAAVVWDPAGSRLAAEVVPAGQPHAGGMELVTLDGGDVGSTMKSTLPFIPRCAKPAAWVTTPTPALLVRPDEACSESITADGLALDAYPLAGGAPTHVLDSQLTYPDWLQVVSPGLLVISGGDRQVTAGKQLRQIDLSGPATIAIGDTTPTSFAVGGTTIARVQVPKETPDGYASPTTGHVYLSDLDGKHLHAVVGVDDARAVTRAPGGFLIIGITELHEVYDDGTLKDLGPVDGVSNDYYGHLTPTDVVLPALD